MCVPTNYIVTNFDFIVPLTHCENCKNILPLRFFVKSVVSNGKWQKVSFLQFWCLWILNWVTKKIHKFSHCAPLWISSQSHVFLLFFQCNLGQAGELSIWEFSGVETYHMIYDHFIGNTNCIHTIVFNVEDSPEVQLNQLRYWFHFLQSRIPPVEPLGMNS